MTPLPTVRFLSVPVSLYQEISQRLAPQSMKLVQYPDPVELQAANVPEESGCVVLYDWSDGQDSLDLIRRLTETEVPARVLLLVTNANVSIAARASRAGAEDVLMANEPVGRLVNVIRRSVECDLVERPRAISIREQVQRFNLLSPGERAVLRYMMSGDSNKIIAKNLDVSQRTVEARRQKVFQKSGLGSLAGLAQMCAKLEKHLQFLRFDEGHEGPATPQLPSARPTSTRRQPGEQAPKNRKADDASKEQDRDQNTDRGDKA